MVACQDRVPLFPISLAPRAPAPPGQDRKLLPAIAIASALEPRW